MYWCKKCSGSSSLGSISSGSLASNSFGSPVSSSSASGAYSSPVSNSESVNTGNSYQTLDQTSPSLGASNSYSSPSSSTGYSSPFGTSYIAASSDYSIPSFNSVSLEVSSSCSSPSTKSRSSFSNSALSNHGFSATDISVGNSSPITEEASDDYVSPASALISTASDFGSRSAADLLSTSDVSPQQSPVASTGVISPGSSATGSFSSPVKNQLMVMSHQSDLHYQIVTV